MNLLASFAVRSASRSTKHFWLARIVARIDLGRDVEERRLEFAHQHDRPFDEAGDLVEQALVLDQLEPVGEREVVRVGEDDVLAPVGVEHDLGLGERGDVIVEAADLDRLRRHEAMAVGRRRPPSGRRP